MVGWRCVCVTNKALSILKLFYVVPAVAQENMNKITEKINSLSGHTTELMEEARKKGKNDTVVRGKELREFSSEVPMNPREKPPPGVTLGARPMPEW